MKQLRSRPVAVRSRSLASGQVCGQKESLCPASLVVERSWHAPPFTSSLQRPQSLSLLVTAAGDLQISHQRAETRFGASESVNHLRGGRTWLQWLPPAALLSGSSGVVCASNAKVACCGILFSMGRSPGANFRLAAALRLSAFGRRRRPFVSHRRVEMNNFPLPMLPSEHEGAAIET